MVNKVLFRHGFHFGISLTCIHFYISSVSMLLMAWLGLFEVKKVPLRAMLPVAFIFSVGLVLANLSLDWNSIGFYQLMKILQTPLVGLIEFLFYGQKRSLKEGVGLAIICVGIGIATVRDAGTNVVGTVIAVAAALFQSGSHINSKSVQHDLDANALQMLYYQFPLSAAILTVSVVVFDNKVLAHSFDLRTGGLLLLSAFMGFWAIVSGWFVLKSTSALTFSVVGHLKTTLILFWGFIFFDADLSARTAIGSLLALAGMVVYSMYRSQEIYRKEGAWWGGAAAAKGRLLPIQEEKTVKDEVDGLRYGILRFLEMQGFSSLLQWRSVLLLAAAVLALAAAGSLLAARR
eukprot:tig00000269_g23783.t1